MMSELDAGVGNHAAAVLGQDALDRLLQRAGLGVVDPDDAGLRRLQRVERGEAPGASTRMMPPDISCADRPCAARIAWNAIGHGWFFDLGGDFALDVLADDDGPSAEGGEAGDHVRDAGAVPGDRDPGLLAADDRARREHSDGFGPGARDLGPGPSWRSSATSSSVGRDRRPGQEGLVGAEGDPDRLALARRPRTSLGSSSSITIRTTSGRNCEYRRLSTPPRLTPS